MFRNYKFLKLVFCWIVVGSTVTIVVSGKQHAAHEKFDYREDQIKGEIKLPLNSSTTDTEVSVYICTKN